MPFDASFEPAGGRPGRRPNPQYVVDSLMSWIEAVRPDDLPVLRDDPADAMYDVLGWMLAHHPGALAIHRLVELQSMDFQPMSPAQREDICYLAEQIEAAFIAADRNPND